MAQRNSLQGYTDFLAKHAAVLVHMVTNPAASPGKHAPAGDTPLHARFVCGGGRIPGVNLESNGLPLTMQE